MHIPAAFSETETAKLHEFIERNSFAVLTSSGEGGLVASHLPLLIDPDAGPNGHLLGHMARANSQWRRGDGGGRGGGSTARSWPSSRLRTPTSRRRGTRRRAPSRPGTTSPSTPTAHSTSSR